MLDSSSPLGPQWFEIFRKELTKKWHDDNWGFDYRNKPWTKAMIEFLLELGSKQGYEARREEGKRDVSWFRSHSLEVHIEHENDGESWENLSEHEIKDLKNSSAKLKILVTYVKPEDYPAYTYAKNLIDILNEDSERGSEWLLVISPSYPEESADYVAHYLRPTFTHDLLVIPSGKWNKK